MLHFSKFARQFPARVESCSSLGPYGTHDMAGKVREWCWNSVEKFRYLLGGGWDDPRYELIYPTALDPFNRAVLLRGQQKKQS